MICFYFFPRRYNNVNWEWCSTPWVSGVELLSCCRKWCQVKWQVWATDIDYGYSLLYIYTCMYIYIIYIYIKISKFWKKNMGSSHTVSIDPISKPELHPPFFWGIPAFLGKGMCNHRENGFDWSKLAGQFPCFVGKLCLSTRNVGDLPAGWDRTIGRVCIHAGAITGETARTWCWGIFYLLQSEESKF